VAALQDAPIRYARAGDVNIAYQVLDGGPVDIVYVPGLLNLIESAAEEPALERHFERMATFAKVVIFDKRGTGLSDRVPVDEMADVEARVADITAVMDAVELPRAALFATGDGAVPAILFAARHPQRVDALVIVEGTARLLADEGYQGFARNPVSPREQWNEQWGNENDPLSVELVTPSMAHDPRWRRVLGRMQRRAGTPSAAHSFWQTFAESDVRAALDEVRAPALVLHAVGDRLIPVAQGRAIAERIPGARFVELPGADHFHWFTNADRVAAETQELLTGARGGAGGARRLLTVLFTDIVESTTRAGELGDSRWRDLLSSHDRLVRSYLDRYGGQEVKFTGDGVLALFDDPHAALECASALTIAVRDLGLEIRAGIHTGMVEMRGDDVGGMAVHVAARVLATAGASEVLVTRTVRDLMLGLEVKLEPRGGYDLKGVPEHTELYVLVGA
jgi:class 3 adenylate cyclase